MSTGAPAAQNNSLIENGAEDRGFADGKKEENHPEPPESKGPVQSASSTKIQRGGGAGGETETLDREEETTARKRGALARAVQGSGMKVAMITGTDSSQGVSTERYQEGSQASRDGWGNQTSLNGAEGLSIPKEQGNGGKWKCSKATFKTASGEQKQPAHSQGRPWKIHR
ncbi:uncharacterized protein LOC144366088 [Ictidomys tridecemlineatus]